MFFHLKEIETDVLIQTRESLQQFKGFLKLALEPKDLLDRNNSFLNSVDEIFSAVNCLVEQRLWESAHQLSSDGYK